MTDLIDCDEEYGSYGPPSKTTQRAEQLLPQCPVCGWAIGFTCRGVHDGIDYLPMALARMKEKP